MENDCRACACDRDDKTNHGSVHTCRPAHDREQRTIAILARIPASAVEYALNCAGNAETQVWLRNASTSNDEALKKLSLDAFLAKLESLASVFPANVQRWEYLSENVDRLGHARADALGAEGWEMVAFVPDGDVGEVWFKRRLP